MGQVRLAVDDYARQITRVERNISVFNRLRGADQFLLIPRYPDDTIILVTDNRNSENLSEATRKFIEERVQDNPYGGLMGAQQGNAPNKPFMIYIRRVNQHNPLNVLAHEIGHFKWPGLHIENNPIHAPMYYRLMHDALKALGLSFDPFLDGGGVDITNVKAPYGSDVKLSLTYNL